MAIRRDKMENMEGWENPKVDPNIYDHFTCDKKNFNIEKIMDYLIHALFSKLRQRII